VRWRRSRTTCTILRRPPRSSATSSSHRIDGRHVHVRSSTRDTGSHASYVRDVPAGYQSKAQPRGPRRPSSCRQKCASSCGRPRSAVTGHISCPAMPRLRESPMCLLAARSAAACKRTRAVARVDRAATDADAPVAAGWDEDRASRRQREHCWSLPTIRKAGLGGILFPRCDAGPGRPEGRHCDRAPSAWVPIVEAIVRDPCAVRERRETVSPAKTPSSGEAFSYPLRRSLSQARPTGSCCIALGGGPTSARASRIVEIAPDVTMTPLCGSACATRAPCRIQPVAARRSGRRRRRAWCR